MITDQDITKLKKVFVTKDDAKKFATKADLKLLVTKKDHDRLYNTLIANMATKADLARLESRFDSLEENFSRVMNNVDKLVGNIQDLYQEMAFSAAQYKRQLEWNYKVGKKVGIPFDY